MKLNIPFIIADADGPALRDELDCAVEDLVRFIDRLGGPVEKGFEGC